MVSSDDSTRLPVKSKSTTPEEQKMLLLLRHKKPKSWTMTNLSAGRRREVIQLVTEMEQKLMKSSNQQWKMDGGLDVLSQWSRLGEGECASSVATKLIRMMDDPTQKIKAHRLVLHAWSNELTRLCHGVRLVRGQKLPPEEWKAMAKMPMVSCARWNRSVHRRRCYKVRGPARLAIRHDDVFFRTPLDSGCCFSRVRFWSCCRRHHQR